VLKEGNMAAGAEATAHGLHSHAYPTALLPARAQFEMNPPTHELDETKKHFHTSL
jgi:hypothetical protein